MVAAAIVRDGCVLAAQRRTPTEMAGRWELPGGKVEAGQVVVDVTVPQGQAADLAALVATGRVALLLDGDL